MHHISWPIFAAPRFVDLPRSNKIPCGGWFLLPDLISVFLNWGLRLDKDDPSMEQRAVLAAEDGNAV
jgi:hypothetical protein